MQDACYFIKSDEFYGKSDKLEQNKTKQKTTFSWAVVVHTFNPSTWEEETEASLVYRVSSRTAKAMQRNPVSEKQNKTKQTKTKQTNQTNKT